MRRIDAASDASNLWLARELAIPLVTFDRRLAVEAYGGLAFLKPSQTLWYRRFRVSRRAGVTQW